VIRERGCCADGSGAGEESGGGWASTRGIAGGRKQWSAAMEARLKQKAGLWWFCFDSRKGLASPATPNRARGRGTLQPEASDMLPER
jgi:hypothetical protein